jgi:hypothetical protein
MTKAERLNTITRLLLIVVAILWLAVKSNLWLTVLASGIVVILLIYFFNIKRRQGFRASTQFHPVPPIPTPVNPPRPHRLGSIGMETKVAPRTSTCRIDGVKPTVLFRKR